MPSLVGRGASARAERGAVLMGTVAVIEVSAAAKATAEEAADRMLLALEAADRRLSTWRDDTELSGLNRAPAGGGVTLSWRTARDLRDARHWCEQTDAAFDPAVGRLVQLWDLRGAGRTPRDAELATARRQGGLAGWSLHGQQAVRRGDLLFEEGGFGKGAALRDALAEAPRPGPVDEVWLDLGGQVARAGGSGSRLVPIAHPSDRERAILTLPLESGSLSTSGNSERGVVVGGETRGHILDPRTGRPAPVWGSVTVWHPDALAADALSTALYVMGPDAAVAWAEAHPPARVLAVELRGSSLRLHASGSWRTAIRPLTPLTRAWEALADHNTATTGADK